jgi:adenine-specific DNA-methyltransferase
MNEVSNKKLTRLVSLLQELFQLDQPDLDFGIYRIMHAKAGEVTQFLERDLLPQVKDAFSQFQSADSAELKRKLDQMVAQLTEAGVDPDTAPKVRELREQLKGAIDIGALENEVYDHLYSFFRRYYSEGDFLAKRVYKPGVYAIPYEGEEVTLHWANKDQYYIKTSEYLRDYAFRLRPESAEGQGPMRVHFRLVDAAEGEHGNVKAAEGKDRVFVLAKEDFIGLGNGELDIRFEYRPATLDDWPEGDRAGKKKPPAQKELTALAVERILASSAEFKDWLDELKRPHVKADGEQAEYNRLEAHLRRYTARNTFDYFIHKDLGAFLRRELDFYIKNEVMHLDDIEDETAPRVEQYLSKIKVIRRIAGKVIDFLAQLENFQKKLWLKKKFVVETRWLVAITQVPDNLLPEVCANESQLNEWKTLHSLHELPADITREAYSEPLTPEYLRRHPTLMVDTGHFEPGFVARLLEHVDGLDERVDGLLVHSENFQALQLMKEKLKSRVHCIYIDPPYNAKTSEILYKNSYKHSSWLAYMESRVSASAEFRSADGVFVCAIDENEQERLGLILDQVFPLDEKTCVSVVHNPRGIQGSGFSYTNEFAYFMHRRGLELGLRALEDSKSKPLMKTGSESERASGKNCFYPIYIRAGKVCGFGDVPSDGWSPASAVIERKDGSTEVWPISVTDGMERKWRYARQSIEGVQAQLEVRQGRDGSPVVNLAKDYESYRTVWSDPVFNAAEYGSTLLKNIVGSDAAFSFPKSLWTVVHSLKVSNARRDTIVMDYFAGSGTTVHAVMHLNREDGGVRKFVAVEMADYFVTVTLPRAKKVAFSPDWKEGAPRRLASPEEESRSSRLIKVLLLESYEDSLNNLALRRTEQQQAALNFPAPGTIDGLREHYLLRYQLNVESKDSASLLNIGDFSDPAAYRLKVKRPGSDESREVNVDLLETFNWLLGLTVQQITAPRSFRAEFDRDAEGRLKLKGRLRQSDDGPFWFRTVTGTTPEGRKTLVIWRKLTGEPEQDNLVLEEWFKNKQAYSVRDTEFDLIYVNGDNTLENLRVDPETWKVRLIEEDFHRLMFEGTEA